MNSSFQTQLFEQIFTQFVKKSDAINKISETLNMSRDSVYRRVRGTTLLTPDEMKDLALIFRISLDSLIYQENDIVLFQYRPQNRPITSFEEYLKAIVKDFERMYAIPNHRMYYATTEIPLFYFLAIPELRILRMYSWGRMAWELPYLNDLKFSFDIIPQSAHILAQEIVRIYMNMPSTEVWSINILDNTINQINYMVNTGSFKDINDALLICDKLAEFVDLLKLMAKKGKKGATKAAIEASNIDFNLHQNEILPTTNTVLATSEELSVVFSSFAAPNFIKSVDQKFCKNTLEWFNKLTARSVSISITTERQRQWYFNVLHTKVSTLRKRIDLTIQEQGILM
jgi:hypothetical protein